jgi:hypothetical protein
MRRRRQQPWSDEESGTRRARCRPEHLERGHRSPREVGGGVYQLPIIDAEDGATIGAIRGVPSGALARPAALVFQTILPALAAPAGGGVAVGLDWAWAGLGPAAGGDCSRPGSPMRSPTPISRMRPIRRGCRTR